MTLKVTTKLAWINMSHLLPARPGLYLVYCGRDTCNLPIYFLCTYSDSRWWIDESEDALPLPVKFWAEITPPEAAT